MPNICLVCNHVARKAIDRQLISGISPTRIAKEHGLNINSVINHRDRHLSTQLKTAMERKQLTEDFNLLERIDDLLTKAQDIFDRNYAKKRDHLALKALSEQRNTLELLSKISFALHEAKRLDEQQNEEQNQYEQEIQLQHDLNVLTTPELELFNLLSQKLETQDKSMKIIPQKSVKSNRVPQHFTMQSDDRPGPDPNEEITSGRMSKTDGHGSKFVRTKPPKAKKD